MASPGGLLTLQPCLPEASPTYCLPALTGPPFSSLPPCCFRNILAAPAEVPGISRSFSFIGPSAPSSFKGLSHASPLGGLP